MPRTYNKSKHLSALHEKYGVTDGKTCDTCYYLQGFRCTFDYKCNHWNRLWQACGKWTTDVDINGWEWVDTADGWKMKAKK